MPKKKVDYDSISSTYNNRYKVSGLEGVTKELGKIVINNNFKNILEVGCGTCKWLIDINKPGIKLFGLDPSLGMLKGAKESTDRINLIGGVANHLPFIRKSFDFIFSVNSLHFFEDKKEFIHSSKEFLKNDGILAIVNIDPRKIGRSNWFMYKYFDRTYELDLERFPAWDNIARWMNEAGYENVKVEVVHSLKDNKPGAKIFDDNFIQKDQASQLALLTDEEYLKGLERINSAVKTADDDDEEIIFPVRLDFAMISGRNGNDEF